MKIEISQRPKTRRKKADGVTAFENCYATAAWGNRLAKSSALFTRFSEIAPTIRACAIDMAVFRFCSRPDPSIRERGESRHC